MPKGTRALVCAAAVVVAAPTLFAGGIASTQGGGGGATRTVLEYTSAESRDPGWKSVTHVVSSSAASAFRWSLPDHPDEAWTQRVDGPDRAAYRVRSVQGRLERDAGAAVAFDDGEPSSMNFPSHAVAADGRPVRARRGIAIVRTLTGTSDADLATLSTDQRLAALFETRRLVTESSSWVERFGGGWLYLWRVRNANDTDYDFDWPAAPVQGPDGWSGTVAAGYETVAARFDRARPRVDDSSVTFTVPGAAFPASLHDGLAYRPAERRARAARLSRGYPPAVSICGDVDAALLSGDPEHDALVVRTAGRALVTTESTVERIGERWGYVWRVRNATSQDLTFTWPAVTADGGEWTKVVAAGSEAELRLLDGAPPFVAQGRVTFVREGTTEEEFGTSAAAYVPRPDPR